MDYLKLKYSLSKHLPLARCLCRALLLALAAVLARVGAQLRVLAAPVLRRALPPPAAAGGVQRGHLSEGPSRRWGPLCAAQ